MSAAVATGAEFLHTQVAELACADFPEANPIPLSLKLWVS
jgi:hypothetical protein